MSKPYGLLFCLQVYVFSFSLWDLLSLLFLVTQHRNPCSRDSGCPLPHPWPSPDLSGANPTHLENLGLFSLPSFVLPHYTPFLFLLLLPTSSPSPYYWVSNPGRLHWATSAAHIYFETGSHEIAQTGLESVVRVVGSQPCTITFSTERVGSTRDIGPWWLRLRSVKNKPWRTPMVAPPPLTR